MTATTNLTWNRSKDTGSYFTIGLPVEYTLTKRPDGYFDVSNGFETINEKRVTLKAAKQLAEEDFETGTAKRAGKMLADAIETSALEAITQQMPAVQGCCDDPDCTSCNGSGIATPEAVAELNRKLAAVKEWEGDTTLADDKEFERRHPGAIPAPSAESRTRKVDTPLGTVTIDRTPVTFIDPPLQVACGLLYVRKHTISLNGTAYCYPGSLYGKVSKGEARAIRKALRKAGRGDMASAPTIW